MKIKLYQKIKKIQLILYCGNLQQKTNHHGIHLEDNIAEKGDYKDFMSKEIDEQSFTTKKCINEYLDKSRNEINIYNLPIDPIKINVSLLAFGSIF